MRLSHFFKTHKHAAEGRKRAFVVPVLLCAIAMLPVFREVFEWADAKTVDLMFRLTPVWRQIFSRPELPDHEALVVAKDNTFVQRFGRQPDRSDLAAITEVAIESGAKVIAYDFVFESETEPVADRRFADALQRAHFPILAERSFSRGQHSFEQLIVADEKAHRPPWPVPVISRLRQNAALTGLINIVSDFDSTVRYLPLAFLPDEYHEFVPSLGYAAWLASMIADSETEISIAIAKLDPQSELFFYQLLESAPEKFASTGHEGLDLMSRRQELLLLARIAASIHVGQASKLKKLAESIAVKSIPAATWLKMPSAGFPLIGDYYRPLLRIFFNRESPPLLSDGVPTISMGSLLETARERESAQTLARNYLNINAQSAGHEIKADSALHSPGQGTVIGRAAFLSGAPVVDADLLLLMPETGYWQLGRTDHNGEYQFNGIPTGTFVLELTTKSENGWQRSVMTAAIRDGLDELSMPLLIMPDFAHSLSIEKQDEELDAIAVFGEAIALCNTDEAGAVAFSVIPEGYEAFALNEDIDVSFDDGRFFIESGKIAANETIALLPSEGTWVIKFFYKGPPKKESQTIFTHLPAALDVQVVGLCKSAESSARRSVDSQILPGEINFIAEQLPPMSFDDTDVEVRLSQPDQAVAVTMYGEHAQIIRVKVDSKNKVPQGRYLMLAEANERRGLIRGHNFSNKALFFGSSLPEDQDLVVTPVNFLDPIFARVPGVNLHLLLYSSLRRNSFFPAFLFHHDNYGSIWPILQLLLLIPFFFMLDYIFARAGALWGGVSSMFLLSGQLGLAIWLFTHQLLIPVFYPAVQIFLFGVFRGYVAYAIARRRENEARNTFGRFISKEVVDLILNSPDSLRPGGEKKELSVIFTDLAGFTTISEQLPPEQLTTLMNNYLDEMTKIVFKYGGTLDKYIGDAIMAFWNHPQLQADHATRAVLCTIEMQKRLKELRQSWADEGLPEVQMRAGINSAVCMVGFIGSDIQMNFTCLGDGVNLAARLEGANKNYDTYIMVSEDVYRQLDCDLISCRFLDFLAVKGKNKPVKVYEVRGPLNDEPKVWCDFMRHYDKGVAFYLGRDWNKAIASFQAALELVKDDHPAQLFVNRCTEFMSSPPPEDWDGRYTMTSK